MRKNERKASTMLNEQRLRRQATKAIRKLKKGDDEAQLFYDTFFNLLDAEYEKGLHYTEQQKQANS